MPGIVYSACLSTLDSTSLECPWFEFKWGRAWMHRQHAGSNAPDGVSVCGYQVPAILRILKVCGYYLQQYIFQVDSPSSYRTNLFLGLYVTSRAVLLFGMLDELIEISERNKPCNEPFCMPDLVLRRSMSGTISLSRNEVFPVLVLAVDRCVLAQELGELHSFHPNFIRFHPKLCKEEHQISV